MYYFKATFKTVNMYVSEIINIFQFCYQIWGRFSKFRFISCSNRTKNLVLNLADIEQIIESGSK